MKKTLQTSLTALCLGTALLLPARAEDSSAGYVDFGKLTPSASGGEFVEVNVRHNLISMAARLAESSEPEVAEVLRGLQRVRVNVIGLKDDNRDEVQERIATIRERLDDLGWERIVTAQQKTEEVSVFLKTRGEDAIEGVVVMVVEGKRQAVLVNVVGDLKPEKIAVVGERFNIEPLKKLGRKLNP